MTQICVLCKEAANQALAAIASPNLEQNIRLEVTSTPESRKTPALGSPLLQEAGQALLSRILATASQELSVLELSNLSERARQDRIEKPKHTRVEESEGYQYSTSRYHLLESSKKGCPLCTLIWDGLLRTYAKAEFRAEAASRWSEDERPLGLRLRYGSKTQEAWYDVKCVSVTEGNNSLAYLEVCAEEGDPAADFVSTRAMNPCVSSEAAFSLAREWMALCLETHSGCPKNSTSLLPTRVLNVKITSKSKEDEVKVYITSLETAPYVVLSYCWGGPQPITSTTDTIQDRIRGIKVHSLPRTIQDAINATRNLGLRYLWVDALCILQDSPEDKAQELGKMAHIYANAHVTIAATSAANVYEGFLQTRTPQVHEPKWFPLPFACPNRREGSILAREHLRYRAVNEPINHRAWTLQEDVLSPRVLSYDSYSLRWQCTAGRYRDGGLEGELDHSQGLNERVFLSSHHPRKFNNSFEQSQVLEDWLTTLEEYSWRGISFLSDKLPAISAIAEAYGTILGSEYLAGLWQNHLLQCLLWYNEATGTDMWEGSEQTNPWRRRKATRLSVYTAPSWSWASIDCPVHHKRLFSSEGDLKDDRDEFAEIVTWEVSARSPHSPYGEVTAATLVIAGRLKQASLVLVQKEDVRWELADKVVSNSAPLELGFSNAYPDDPNDVDSNVWLLLLHNKGHGLRWMEGLILSSLEDEGSLVFKRKGLFTIWDRPDWFDDGLRTAITII